MVFKSVFLDTNVLLSFHFHDAEEEQQKAIDLIFSALEKKKYKGFISLITLYQLLYFIDRKLKNPKKATQKAYAYLDILHLTPFNPSSLLNLNTDRWPDYEDGLQYACALSGNCEVIVTTNGSDYFASKLPVVDPLNFVLRQHYRF